MTIDLQPQDEVVRIDRRPGQITFEVRRPDKSLVSITLLQPVWTDVQEIGFLVRQVVVSDPDPLIIEAMRSRHPEIPLPEGLRQLHVMDDEATKISIIFANEASAS